MGSGLDCFSGGVLLLSFSFSALIAVSAFFGVFPDEKTVKIVGQMVSPFSEDSSMGLTEVAAELEGTVGALEELVGVEDCAVGCEDLVGAFGVA